MVNSQFDHTFTYEARDTQGAGAAIAWIGYFYNSDTGEWKWISEEPVTFTKHDSHFPQGGTRAYLNVPAHPYINENGGTWNANNYHDDDPDGHPKGIIERALSVPEPSLIILLSISLGAVCIMQRKFKATS